MVENHIETIILIKFNKKDRFHFLESSTFFESWKDSFKKENESKRDFDNFGLLFEIYSSKDSYSKLVATINVETKKNKLGDNAFKKIKTKKHLKKDRKNIFKISKEVFEIMDNLKAFEI